MEIPKTLSKTATRRKKSENIGSESDTDPSLYHPMTKKQLHRSMIKSKARREEKSTGEGSAFNFVLFSLFPPRSQVRGQEDEEGCGITVVL